MITNQNMHTATVDGNARVGFSSGAFFYFEDPTDGLTSIKKNDITDLAPVEIYDPKVDTVIRGVTPEQLARVLDNAYRTSIHGVVGVGMLRKTVCRVLAQLSESAEVKDEYVPLDAKDNPLVAAVQRALDEDKLPRKAVEEIAPTPPVTVTTLNHGEVCANHKQLNGEFCDRCICPELLKAEENGVKMGIEHLETHKDCDDFCQAKRIIKAIELNKPKPTSPPKNEVGKVCVTEPLGIGAVVKGFLSPAIRAGNDTSTPWWVGDSWWGWRHISDGATMPTLLSEGVEG